MKVLILGLRNKRHSHRFIHQGFYNNFLLKGFETYWLDEISELPNLKFDLVFASNISRTQLPFFPTARYILHNINIDDIHNFVQSNIKYINLQVFSKDATGRKMFGLENILWDEKTLTLYQPWGTPLPTDKWMKYKEPTSGDKEYWLGSIWQNSLNQGNLEVMNEYANVLKKHGVKLIRKGGSRIFINGISEKSAGKYIRKSVFGATILGEWQVSNNYIPCRLFKNITYGIPPLSNMKKPNLISQPEGFIDSLEGLLNFALSETKSSRKKRFEAAQKDISEFTYSKAIDRILQVIRE